MLKVGFRTNKNINRQTFEIFAIAIFLKIWFRSEQKLLSTSFGRFSGQGFAFDEGSLGTSEVQVSRLIF